MHLIDVSILAPVTRLSASVTEPIYFRYDVGGGGFVTLIGWTVNRSASRSGRSICLLFLESDPPLRTHHPDVIE